MSLIAHSPIKRFRWFAFHPESRATLIARRNRCIKICAARLTVQHEFRSCLQPSNKGEQVNTRTCRHYVSITAHNTVIDNAKQEVIYLNQKIDQLGEEVEKMMRAELGL